jgi:hypothetical protein
MDLVHAYCTAQGQAVVGPEEEEEDEAPRTILALGHNNSWQLALHDLLNKPPGTIDMKTADCFVLTPKKNKDKDKEEDTDRFHWGDIYSSYGKWEVEHHIRSREVLDKAVKPFFNL